MFSKGGHEQTMSWPRYPTHRAIMRDIGSKKRLKS